MHRNPISEDRMKCGRERNPSSRLLIVGLLPFTQRHVSVLQVHVSEASPQDFRPSGSRVSREAKHRIDERGVGLLDMLQECLNLLDGQVHAFPQLRRVRVLQQQQHQTRRNFFGSTQQGFDVTPEDVGITPQRLGALEQATGLTPIRKGLTERLSGLGQTNFAEDQEDASARGLMQQQQGESRSKAMQEARQKLQQQTKDQIKRLAKQATQKAAAGTVRVGVETAQAVAGPEDMGITWLTLIAEMNLQLILKYVLKGFGYFASQAGRSQEGSSQGTVVNEVNDFANSIQTFWEDVITIWMDCCLVLATGAAMCGPFIIILIINLLILVGIINGANEITSQL